MITMKIITVTENGIEQSEVVDSEVGLALEKTLPRLNCVRFWESLLFHNRAFLPVSTVVIIKATIKHLRSD